jgi:hypothetical protein
VPASPPLLRRSYFNQLVLRLWPALRYVAHVESLLVLGILALLLGLVDRGAALPNAPSTALALLSRTIWAAYFYLVLRKAATGSRRLPIIADYRATWDTLIHPLALGSGAAAWYVLLLMLLVRSTVGIDQFAQQFQLRALDFFRQPSALSHAVLLVTLLQLPPALAASATNNTRLLRFVDPSFGLRVVAQAAEDYLPTYGALQVLVVASFLMGTVSGLLDQALPIPVAGPVLRHMLQVWIPLAQARLLGEFVARNPVLSAKSSLPHTRPGRPTRHQSA